MVMSKIMQKAVIFQLQRYLQRKAFDSMPHKELLSKSKRFGFGENSINGLQAI